MGNMFPIAACANEMIVIVLIGSERLMLSLAADGLKSVAEVRICTAAQRRVEEAEMHRRTERYGILKPLLNIRQHTCYRMFGQ